MAKNKPFEKPRIPSLAEVEKAIQEREYYEFFKAAWNVLEPTTPLQDNWHIKYLCDTLQAEIERLAAGKPKTHDIIINIPPRSLKSTIVTVSLNAWAWTRFPHLRFIGASHNADVAIEMGVKTRRLMESAWYQANWGDRFKFSDDQNCKGLFDNSAGGSRKNIGVGGGITGSGADVIMVDDPIAPEKAYSQDSRETCIRWFKETLYSRLNNQRVGLRIVVMQRLHQEDLTGWILKNQPGLWKHISLPVSDDFEIRPPELASEYKAGLFFPDRFSAEVIAQAKQTLGEYGYAGQMGQAPSPLGGGMIKTGCFQRYSVLPSFTRIFWSWDCAVKITQRNDYSVGFKVGEAALGYYLLDCLRGRWEYPELRQLVQINGDRPEITGVLVEDKSSGQQVKQELRRIRGLRLVTLCSDEKRERQIMSCDKTTRASLVTPTIEAGKVFIPDNASWLADFLTEMSMFPNGTHDDQVDALTQIILHLINTRPASSGILSDVNGDRRTLVRTHG